MCGDAVQALATPLVIGDIVARGTNGKLDEQDDGGSGRVITMTPFGWVRVRWQNGSEDNYRYGVESAYDLKKVLGKTGVPEEVVSVDASSCRASNFSAPPGDDSPPAQVPGSNPVLGMVGFRIGQSQPTGGSSNLHHGREESSAKEPTIFVSNRGTDDCLAGFCTTDGSTK